MNCMGPCAPAELADTTRPNLDSVYFPKTRLAWFVVIPQRAAATSCGGPSRITFKTCFSTGRAFAAISTASSIAGPSPEAGGCLIGQCTGPEGRSCPNGSRRRLRTVDVHGDGFGRLKAGGVLGDDDDLRAVAGRKRHRRVPVTVARVPPP